MKKMIRYFFVFSPCAFFVFLSLYLLTGCKPGDSGQEIGAGVNEGWEVEELTCDGTVTGGTFTDSSHRAAVYIAEGVMSPCVGAKENPVLEASPTVPSELENGISEDDINITAEGKAYVFDIKGSRGFDSTRERPVAITLPFNITEVPAEHQSDSAKIFIRLLNQDDNSLVDLNGTISADTVTVETRGLPRQFAAVVIYNPDIEGISSTDVENASMMNQMLSTIPVSTWPVQEWCVAYNTKEMGKRLQERSGAASPPSREETTAYIISEVYWSAFASQAVYENAGFAAPNLYIASTTSDVCPRLGSTKRYIINLVNIKNRSIGGFYDPGSDKHPYGRIFIDLNYINQEAIAHEIFHAVQQNYLMLSMSTTGCREGSAGTYGATIEKMETDTIAVKPLLSAQLLSDCLMAGEKKGNQSWVRACDTCPPFAAYANQDFFAYVGRRYGGGRLDYLQGLFAQFKKDIDAASAAAGSDVGGSIKIQPPLPLLLTAMDNSFAAQFGALLKDIYLDFVKQRAFEHNQKSWFGRTDEVQSGFAANLFQQDEQIDLNAITDVLIQEGKNGPEVLGGEGSFVKVGPYAARAIRIASGIASEDGLTVIITLTPTGTTGSDVLSGFSSWQGQIKPLTAGVNKFTAFGKTKSDEIDIVMANVNKEQSMSIEYKITVTAETETTTSSSISTTTTAPAKANTFKLTKMEMPGGETFNPVYSWADGSYILFGGPPDANGQATPPYLVIRLHGIYEPGTYTADGNSWIDCNFIASNGKTYYLRNGSAITFTYISFGSIAQENRFTGSFSFIMAEGFYTEGEKTGTITGEFDLQEGYGIPLNKGN